MVSSLDIGQLYNNIISLACKYCIQGKQQRTLFLSGVAIYSRKLLEIIKLDFCWNMKMPSMKGER